MTLMGKVYLVGAGPGDPGLITVKGLALLRQADVVLYDRLAPPELLRETGPQVELIDVGKQPARERFDQATINTLLVEKARAGLQVVRLKGGDPFVFGRGGEEALACYAAGVPFEVVPGVSSAIAVPAYAGVPVTHRQLARSFTVFTAHEDPDDPATALDYGALARLDTLVALMGVKQLARLAAKLQEAGMSPETPAVCIEWGTTEHQRVIEGTLATLPALAAAAHIQPPSTVVIGAVAALRGAGLDWLPAVL